MGLFSRFRRNRDDEQVDPDERSPELGLRYKDLFLLHEITKRAADITQSRHVLFFLYASAAETGQRMAEEARVRGFEVSMAEPVPDYPGSWPVRCEMHAVVSPDFVRENVDFFEDLAKRHDAEYDGWEAAAN